MHVHALDLMCVPYRINRKFLPMSKKYRNLLPDFVHYRLSLTQKAPDSLPNVCQNV